MKKDILICGVGGQGTVLASKIIAASAMDEGSAVHSAETIGMAQRGGSVTSHVRIGEAYAPLITQGAADMILAFEPAEAVRNLGYLKKDGIVIVNRVPVKPVAGYRVRRHRDDCVSAEEMQLYRNRCRENLCTVWLVAIFQHCHPGRGSWKRTAWNQQGNRARRA